MWCSGVSVAQLAEFKQLDLRTEFSCWLSHPVFNEGFNRILCIESGWRGTPPEITDDLFRALAPCSIAEFPNGRVAMPLVGAGDQAYSPDVMLESILRSAVSWFRRGLAIKVLKIVVFSQKSAETARKKFIEFQHKDSAPKATTNDVVGVSSEYDVFVSYCHKDIEHARLVMDTLQRVSPHARIFFDNRTIPPGASWLMKLGHSLDRSKRVVALYSPSYWNHKYCTLEFSAAFTRQFDTGDAVLYPIYLVSADFPRMFQSIQFIDCRESDTAKLVEASRALGCSLS